MALSLLLCAAQLVDYGAKVALLVCLRREPGLRAHFLATATAHVAANMHNSYLFFRAAPRLPLGLLAPLVLGLGVLTPLMQVVHVCDAVAAWWVSQDAGRRMPLRSAPLDVVLEGLTFVVATLHIQISMVLGRLAPHLAGAPPPAGGAWGPRLEAVLSLATITSLTAVAAALVIWDSSVSLKLSRDMYGWPGQQGGGLRGCGVFLTHLVFRGSEVAGKSALLASLAALLGTGCALRYAAASYLCVLLVLVLLSSHRALPRKPGSPPATPVAPVLWPLLSSSVLAWPLLFANLPQFVDCPKHAAAAQNLAGVLCGFRALELAAVLSAVVAAVLLEEELTAIGGSCGRGASACPCPRLGLGLGLGGFASAGVAGLLRAWRALYERHGTLGWVLCSLLHYACVASRWWGWTTGEVPPHLATFPPGPGGVSSPRSGVGHREDFWPPAIGLVPLLLAAACERAPLAWPLDRAVASGSGLFGQGRGAGAAERHARVEDFEIIRLIGAGEFGKVFQVKHRATQEVYAMKQLSKDFYQRRRMVDKAIREIATLHLARDHPFVVRLVWDIENAREWALVMEYCPGGSLQQVLLAEGSPGLPLSRTLKISAEVALALEHLHARGIVFRDLKLENVVIDAEGYAKLTDFGLAKQHRGGRDAIAEAEQNGDVYASFTKTFCGSFGYAAPEVNPRRQVHGFAADMYSYGVLMLMMLMGGEVYHDSREPPHERRLPPETPKDLRDVLNQLTFEFYWASHHFLLPACSAHTVEVNLSGAVVVVSKGPRGARRQERPRRPPNSPRALEHVWPPPSPAASGSGASAGAGTGPEPPEARAAVRAGGQPAHFPALARSSSEAAQRRWELAMDLIRVLTNEFPEHRGTVGRVKQHPFFAEEIADWRTVYPRGWLLERVKAKLQALCGAAPLPRHWELQLGRLSAEELISLLDEPAALMGLLETASMGAAALGQGPSGTSGSPRGPAAAASSSGGAHDWAGNYP